MINMNPAKTPKRKPEDESKLGFGQIFTDNMLTWKYDTERGWHDMTVEPFGPLALDPSTMVLHYGQSVFEGLKAYKAQDGGINLFRAEDNFRRMNRSNARLCIPAFDEDEAMAGLRALLEVEKDWTPASPGTSLYIRPTIIATDPFVGVRASNTYLFYIILSPVGAYYQSGLAPVGIYVEDELVRAVKGGMGFAKTGGNYAASLLGGEIAKKRGLAQVLWLDGIHHRYVEEVGAMNIFFKIGGKILTPPLEGSILGGITRDSVIKLCNAKGLEVCERPIAIDEVYEAAESGTLEEMFGTGTAAVISPVGKLVAKDREIIISGGEMGPLSKELYDTLVGIQYGSVPDRFGWITRL